MYKVLSAESCSGGDTQQPAAAASFSQATPAVASTPHKQPTNQSIHQSNPINPKPIHPLHPPSMSLL
jgi:hypothetical protein